jgi:hypothetical protein
MKPMQTDIALVAIYVSKNLNDFLIEVPGQRRHRQDDLRPPDNFRGCAAVRADKFERSPLWLIKSDRGVAKLSPTLNSYADHDCKQQTSALPAST